MKKLLKSLLVLTGLGLVTSCYYGAYDYGYNQSYGFSGGGTTFIHTSSDRWIYDSAVRCYYDRHRSSYYDPWLGGYYPRGYSPRPVYHMPHPYGWSGRGACPPPRNVSYRQIDRYHDRLALIRERNYQWAQNVRVQQGGTAARFQANRAQQAANFRHAQAAQQQRNQQAVESLRARNEQVRDAYRNRSNGYQQGAPNPRSWNGRGATVPSQSQSRDRNTVIPYQPQRGGNAAATRRSQSVRPGYNQPVSTLQQAQRERADRLRQAQSDLRQRQVEAVQQQRQKQAAAVQRQRENPPQWNNPRRGGQR